MSNYLSRLKQLDDGKNSHNTPVTVLTKLTEGACVSNVSSYMGHIEEKIIAAANLEQHHSPPIVGQRWNPEMASQGYVWCLDCKNFNEACTHPDNPFRKQQPLAPRKCQWYEAGDVAMKGTATALVHV